MPVFGRTGLVRAVASREGGVSAARIGRCDPGSPTGEGGVLSRRTRKARCRAQAQHAVPELSLVSRRARPHPRLPARLAAVFAARAQPRRRQGRRPPRRPPDAAHCHRGRASRAPSASTTGTVRKRKQAREREEERKTWLASLVPVLDSLVIDLSLLLYVQTSITPPRACTL